MVLAGHERDTRTTKSWTKEGGGFASGMYGRGVANAKEAVGRRTGWDGQVQMRAGVGDFVAQVGGLSVEPEGKGRGGEAEQAE